MQTIKLIDTAKPHIRRDGRFRTKGLYQCYCGNVFEAVVADVKRGKTKSCGCYQIERTKLKNTTHGLSGKPEYWKYYRSVGNG